MNRGGHDDSSSDDSMDCHNDSGSGTFMNALACSQCGAGLPPPDAMGRSWCVYCNTEFGSDRARGMFDEQLPPLSERQGGSLRESWHDGEDAARIPMTEEAVLQLVRQHFDCAESVFMCPHIPPRKEQAARRIHAAHLSPRERILALYDASRLGSGDEGFIVTSRRLCWRNAGDPARSHLNLFNMNCSYSIEWRDFDPELLYIGGGQLFVGNDGILINDDVVLDACANAFHVLALSGLPPRPMNSGPVPRDTSPELTPLPFATPLADADLYSDELTEESFVGTRPAAPPPAIAGTTSYVAYASHAESSQTDFSCWHCKTPLHAKTPQCSFCGAKPKKKGWLRAG